MTPLDYSAFFAPVNPHELAEFRRATPRWGSFGDLQNLAKTAVIVLVLSVLGVAFFASLFDVSSRDYVTSLLQLVVALVGVASLVGFWLWKARAKWVRWFRLSRFSEANGLVFTANGSVPQYPGMIFGVGSHRRVSDRISQVSDPFFDFGNLTYTTGSGKSRKVHHWGYIAIKLERKLPQIVLDAKSNNFLGSNLPTSFSRSQVLSLEGDFDRYFTLYCPKEYERDALYVFTPDLMVRLIDDAAAFDVELVDDWMFFYSSQRIDITNTAWLRQVFTVINTVGTKTLAQTERYADSTMAEDAGSNGGSAAFSSRMKVNIVSPRGRRLKSGIPVATTVLIGAVILVWAFFMTPHFFA